MKTIGRRINEGQSCFFRVCGLLQTVLLGTFLAAGVTSVRAAKPVFQRSKPHVNVGSIGHVELREPAVSFDFMAELETDSSGAGWGTIQVGLSDGSVRSLHATIGRTILEGHQALVFFLLLPGLSSGQLDPTQPATAMVYQTGDKVFWEIAGTGISDEALSFEVPGEIRLSREAAPEPRPPWFDLRYEPQQVKILGTDVMATFKASGQVLRDQTATGLVELGFLNGGRADPLLRFEPVYGALSGTTATGPTYIVLLLEGAPLVFDNLAVATIRPNPTVPGCDIWDFASNAGARGSRFHVQFDAIGGIQFHGRTEPPSGGDAPVTFSSRTEIELGAADPTALGVWNLSQAIDENWRANHGKDWAYLHGWKRRTMAANFLVEADHVPIAVLFSAETRVDDPGKRMFVRLLVDGEPMHPGDVVLAAGESADRQAAQSFEFTGIYDRGLHTVEVQWMVDEKGSGYIRNAALLIRQGNSAEARPLLVAVTPESGLDLETQSTLWKDVPGLEADIQMPTDRHHLTATVSAEAYSSSGDVVWIRVLVDGVVAEPGPVRFASGGFEGTRTMLFGVTDPAPGNHNVRVQWKVSRGGTATLGDRTLTLAAGASGNDQVVRQYARFAQNEIHPTGAYATVPDMSQFAFFPEDSDAAVIFTAEFLETPSAPVWARLSIAGVPVPESEVLLANKETSVGVHAYIFDAKHIAAESFSLVGPIRIEWMGEGVQGNDPDDSKPSIGARSMAVHIREHIAPDLAEAPRIGDGVSFDNLTAESMGVEPAFGRRNILVILFDPHRPDDPAPSIADITEAFFGASDSIADYFDKVSGGRFMLVNAGVLGPYDAKESWEYYWADEPGRDQDKWQEAMQAAAAEFDFAAYDADGDGYISATRELAVFIVVPQVEPASGFVRDLWKDDLPLEVGGVLVERITELYTSDPIVDYDVACHEFGHLVLQLGDLYDKSNSAPSLNTRPGEFCLMDRGGTRIPPHLNPALKLALGWVTPTFVRHDASVSLGEVKTSHEVVVLPRSPGRHADEYLVLENRLKPPNNVLYDFAIPDSGIAVWQIVTSPIDSDNMCVCTSAGDWAANAGDHARRAVRLIRSGVDPGPCSLWTSDPIPGCPSYDLDGFGLVCPSDGAPHNVLLWSTYEDSYDLRNFSAPGPVMTFDVIAP